MSRRPDRRAGRSALAALVLVSIADSASAELASQDPEALVVWLEEHTDISPRSVVAATASTVTSIMQVRPGREPGRMSVNTRAERLNPATEGSPLSWHAAAEVDCRSRRTKLGATTGYMSRNLLGPGRQIRDADGQWSIPAPGTDLEGVLRAVCEPSFTRPFADAEHGR